MNDGDIQLRTDLVQLANEHDQLRANFAAFVAEHDRLSSKIDQIGAVIGRIRIAVDRIGAERDAAIVVLRRGPEALVGVRGRDGEPMEWHAFARGEDAGAHLDSASESGCGRVVRSWTWHPAGEQREG